MEKQRRKSIKVIMGLLLMVIVLMGISFAWYNNVINDSNVQYIKAKDLGDGKIKLIDCEENLLLKNAIPMSDKDGLAQENVCKVEIDNTENDVDLDFSVYLDDKELEDENTDKRMKDSFVRYSFVEEDEEETVEKTKLLSTAGENPNRIIETDSVNKGNKKTYYLKVWIDKDADNTVMGTIFFGKLRVEVGQKRTQKLYIDPNGGTYKGSKEKQEKVLNSGEKIEIEDAVYEGYTFKGWEISNKTTTIEEKKLTMGTGDTTITAIWNVSEDAVARINETYYLTLESALNAAVDNDEIVMIKNTTETVENTKSVTLNLNGYTVTGSENKTITNTGTLTVKGTGTIENKEGVALSNTGVLTVGENDGEIDKENLKIKGVVSGIEQLGTMNFYDGVIEAKVGISGEVADKPESNIVFVEHLEEKSYQKVYLTEETTLAVAKQNDTLYMNLQDAINTEEISQSGSTIYMIRDAELAYTLTVSTGKKVEIDIDGYDISTGYTITNKGILTIKDGNADKGILSPSVTITNNGVLNVKDITIKETTTSDVIKTTNTLNVENSNITGLGGYAINNTGTVLNIDSNSNITANTYALYNASTEKVTVNDGNILGIYNVGNLGLSGNVTVKNTSGNNNINNTKGTLIIDNANLITTNYAIYNKSNLTINNVRIEGSNGVNNESVFTMNDGVINVTGTAVYEQATSTLNGGTITTKSSSASLVIAPGTVTISGASITNEVGLVVALGGSYYSGNIKLDSGSIKAKTNAVDACRGSFEINGGTIEAGGAGINRTCGFSFGGKMTGGYVKTGSTGIAVSQGTFNFTGGKIESNEGYGLYVAANDGVTVNIGTKNEAADITNPEFTGKTYGVYIHSGTVNLYDGILKGQTGGYYGNISSIEDGYLIASGTETINEAVYNTTYLEKMADFAKVGEATFNSLQKAIDSIETEGQIEIINDAYIRSSATVPSTKNIEIDFKGYTLTTSQPLNVQGTLKVTDTSDTLTGTIKSDTNKAINVSSGATVTIDKLNIVSSYGSYVITNAGNLTINDIKIEGKYGINNTSKFIMNDGVINVTGVALYEQATSTLNGGTITTKSSEASLIISPGTVTISGASITNEVGLVVALGGSYYSGNIKLDSGSIKAKTNAVDACRGSFEINGGTIEAGGAGINRTCGFSFGGKMTGGYVKTGSTGIAVSQGTFNFTGGKIESNEGYGLYVAANDGVTVNIGTKNEAADITTPEFIGKTYGLYIHSGTVNLYDGILKGQTGGYYGNISSIEDGYLIASGTETINESVYNTNYLSEETEVAQIGTTKYKNIQTAIDEASSGDTITMIDNATIYYPLTISSDDDITFDLSGYSLSTAKTITNQGDITFVDSVGTSKVNPINPIKLFVNNKAMKFKSINIENNITTNDLVTNNTDSSLVLDNVTIDSLSGIYTKGTTTVTNSNINIKNDHVIENYGSLSVDEGSYITTTSYHSIYHSNASGTLNINNATLSGNYSVYNLNTLETKINNSILTGVLENRNSSTMSVESSTIKGYVTNYSTNKVDVKNKSVLDMNGKAYGVYNYSTGTIDLNDVDVKAVENTTNYNVIYNNTGTINATNLNVDITNNTNASATTSNVVNNNSTGTINLSDFSITSNDLVNSKTLRGIYNNSTGTVNLNNGNISIAGGKQSIGLYSQTANGNINFLKGDVTVTGATTSYGAYINNGNITIGTKDEKVDITTPTIKAVGTTGIGAKKVNGYLKFYDGKITGSTSAKPETTTEVEYGYEVHNYTDENGYEYCILEYME